MRRFVAFLVSLLLALTACEQPPDHAPDAGGPDEDAAARPDAGVAFDDRDPPDNSFLAASSWPIYHGDSYARHSSTLPAVEGPGEDVTVTRVELDGVPVFVLFDDQDAIFAVSRGVTGSALWKIDRATLAVVHRVELSGAGTFAGVYGFVDAAGDVVLGVGRRVVRFEGPNGTLAEKNVADLDATLEPDESLVAASVMFTGEIAFVGSAGTVGVLPADLQAPLATTRLAGEEVSNALSLDEDGGLYVVGSVAIHRIDWTGGQLVERWSYAVEAPFDTPRPGRLGTGSGTTPALMGRDRVVLADDAASLNLIVLRRGPDDAAGPREVCKVPPFDGEATTDNAIVVSGRTMIVEQNLEGQPGVARVDLGDDGRCERVWVADVLAPTCVPTLSTASGLVYVYTHDDTLGWALTGLDLETGATRLTVPTGTGAEVNNFYAAVTVGPDQRIYLGVLGGLLVFEDGGA